MAEDRPEERLNLEKVGVLVVEPNQAEQDLLVQVLSGFGVRHLRRCVDAMEARQALTSFDVGLILIDGSAADGSAYDFVSWLRRHAPEPRRFLPVLLLSGHVRISQVVRARDCGANFLVTKPLSPRVLLDRIAWLGREARGFIAIEDGYVGPDRRFKSFGPPPGVDGRRRDDLSGELGAAEAPNMSQDDIDALMNPRRA
jgi:DNA-binding response OmpR family regulator